MNRGEIHLCGFGDPIGHEQGFRRPAVVVFHEELSRLGLPVVLPVTRTRLGYATHAELEGVLPVTGYVQCEQMRMVSTERFVHRLAAVPETGLLRIDLTLRRILCL